MVRAVVRKEEYGMSTEGLAGRMLPRPDTDVEANQLGLWCAPAAIALALLGFSHRCLLRAEFRFCSHGSALWLRVGSFGVALLQQRAELSGVARCALQVRRHRARGAPSGAHRCVHRRSELGSLRALHRLGQAVCHSPAASPSQHCIRFLLTTLHRLARRREDGWVHGSRVRPRMVRRGQWTFTFCHALVGAAGQLCPRSELRARRCPLLRCCSWRPRENRSLPARIR